MKKADHRILHFFMNYNEEQIIQELTLDGTVMQVGLEIIGQICYHSNATGLSTSCVLLF